MYKSFVSLLRDVKSTIDNPTGRKLALRIPSHSLSQVISPQTCGYKHAFNIIQSHSHKTIQHANHVIVCNGYIRLLYWYVFLRVRRNHISCQGSWNHSMVKLKLFASGSPYAMAAAVGSLMIRKTFSPAIVPASLVDWRWASLKYAGTVTTACLTSLPK